MEKKDEITTISKDELSKVKDNLLNTEQLNFLFAKTPAKHIYERPAKGGGVWKYVTGTRVDKVLNLMFGWNHDFYIDKFDINMWAKQAIVSGRLVVRTGGQEIVKSQFGRSDIIFKTETRKDNKGNIIMTKDNYGNMKPKKFSSDNPLDLGNDLKAAATDALKKCASKLGIASDVYAPNEFKEIHIMSDSEKSDIEKAQRKIIEALDTYQGEDKQNIQEMCKSITAAGEFDMKFAENIAKRLNLEL